MRIYELAKELRISNNELKDILNKKLNMEVSSHMSTISEGDIAKVKKAMSSSNNKAETTNKVNNKTNHNNTSGKKPEVVQKNNNTSGDKSEVKPKVSSNYKGNKPNSNYKGNKTSSNYKGNKPNSNYKGNKPNNNSNNNSNNVSAAHNTGDKKSPSSSKNNREKVLSGIKEKNNNTKNQNNKGSIKANNNYFANKKKREKKKYTTKKEIVVEKTIVSMPDTIILRDLAEMLDMSSAALIGKLIPLGFMVTMNQPLDYETVELLSEEFNFELRKEAIVEELIAIEEEIDFDFEDKKEDLVERPPIVTVMGHVDHGKTSLLDAIRNTAVTTREAGGITQHIGASQVQINGKKITFLDTPGHEAFTSMRARGAQVTDIAILVVAADDGVMPQTIEAIDHAKAAGVPIIVAVNKIDKPGADPSRVLQELAEHGILSEAWGGETIVVEVSAKQNTGIEELLEMILLQSEILELKANPNRKAVGAIVEAKLDKGRGTVASVLVQKGTLRKGDFVLVGSTCGKVRAMFNSRGKRIGIAGPSVAVEILGLNGTPLAGDILYAMEDEKQAKVIADKRKEKERQQNMNKTAKVSLDDLYEQIKQGNVQDLNIILKGDVRGSIEAIKQSLDKLSIDEVKVKVIHSSVGGVNLNDINLAIATGAIVIGFNVRPSVIALDLAKREGIDVRTYNIIYALLEDIQSAVNGMLAPEYKEVSLGRAEIRQTFKVPNIGVVAGVYVTNGKVTRKSKIRILRENIIIHDGEITSLKRFKDDASELNTNFEGGIGIANFQDAKIGDVIEAYIMEEIKREK